MAPCKQYFKQKKKVSVRSLSKSHKFKLSQIILAINQLIMIQSFNQSIMIQKVQVYIVETRFSGSSTSTQYLLTRYIETQDPRYLKHV